MRPLDVEIINAGRRIVREAVTPIYLPIDEDQIIVKEVADGYDGSTRMATIYPDPVVDHWEYDERMEYVPCYALLTFGQYADINRIVSEANGYDVHGSTAREYVMNPPACKVNASKDGYDVRLVLRVSPDTQERFPELFDCVELADDYVPVDSPIQELFVDIDNFDTLNWTLIQFSVGGNSEDGLTLRISPMTLELITSEMLTAIQGLGMNIEV